MIYLLLSIGCSTLIFAVFKLFARYQIRNLPAIVVNYAVAGALGFSTASNGFSPARIIQSEWFTGALFLSFMFIVLFQVMAWVSQKIGIAVVSVAVKMSVVIPVLFGILYYGESTGWVKLLGIGLAIVAVYLATKKPMTVKRSFQYLLLPVLLFVGSGFLDVCIKYLQANVVPSGEQALFVSSTFWAAASLGIFYWVYRYFRFQEKAGFKDFVGGIALGIPNYGSIYFLFKALEYKGLESSIVFPINNVGIVVSSALVALFVFKEKLSLDNISGIVLALLAIVLITFSL